MVYYSRNKNELIVLTGSVYAFVAYLTSFILEVLFIIDLAKQNSDQLLGATATTTHFDPNRPFAGSASALDQAKLSLDSAQTHITISCLAISILYFVLFIASLILIIALIVRSTFMILIWMCTMTTLYLPEFALIIYVSFYGWGISSRNGQTEFLFYLLRAALNIIFILRARKLYKDWNYEKNFFRLKSGSNFTGHDSPYFIGDSLSTTINPMFSSSTLNLNRYDQVRNYNHSSSGLDNIYADFQHLSRVNPNSVRVNSPMSRNSYAPNYGPSLRNYYLREPGRSQPQRSSMNTSSLSINNDNDSFVDYEMNLDYRTITSQEQHVPVANIRQQTSADRNDTPKDPRGRTQMDTTSSLVRSPGGLSYSTQSLDRRHLKDIDFVLPEQVILRPLGHQPFEYLHRPGSTNNINSVNSLNTHTTYNPNAIQDQKRDESRTPTDRHSRYIQ